MNAGRVTVYLWDAGPACGVCGDPGTAARHAEKFARVGQEARVERAVSVADEGMERTYRRTGEAHTGQLVPGGIVLWQPADGSGGIPGWVPAGDSGAKPAPGEFDLAAQAWERSGRGDRTIEVAFPEDKAGRWQRGDWVLMRVTGDPDRRTLVFDRREWLCFLDGARNGEFDGAASPESPGHAAPSAGVPGARTAAADPGPAH